MAYLYKYLLAACVALSMTFCVIDTPVDPPDPRPADPHPKTFLMYDNIGAQWFNSNVAAAGEAVASGALSLQKQRVVVFQRMTAGNIIYELVQDKSAKDGYSKKTLKQYARGENNDLKPQTIKNVVGDMRSLAPAEHFGLAFGSHGKGWIPKSCTVPIARRAAGQSTSALFSELWAERENPLTRYLAGYGELIDIDEFADALDDFSEGWDFILFDDCFMSSVEALYEIRHLADYFIASPTEIMLSGFPYDRVVNALFDVIENDGYDWVKNFATVAEGFVEAYRLDEMYPGYPCATVSVVKTSELDALAATVRNLSLPHIYTGSVSSIQFYEGFVTPGHIFFDLDDYLQLASQNSSLLAAFRAQLDRTVTFAGHTPTFYTDFPEHHGRQYPVTHFSGLSVFIPHSGAPLSLMPYYEATAWYKAVYQ